VVLTEFGTTTDAADLGRFTFEANAHLVRWIYWQGFITTIRQVPTHRAFGLVAHRFYAPVLLRTYAQSIAGVPTEMSFDTSTARFTLDYPANHAITEPTVVFVPLSIGYQGGYCDYCPIVTVGHITSKPGSGHLDIVNDEIASEVTVSVVPGSCKTL
jgi:hypothetical protein